MTDSREIEELIPHRGAMCLLERVVEWDADHIVTATHTHRACANPLRMGERLHALHLCEYAAQAMAVHGGLLARAAGAAGKPGLLVALRDVRLGRARIDDLPQELRVAAVRLLASASSWQYSFSVHHGAELLATGRAAIIARKG